MVRLKLIHSNGIKILIIALTLLLLVVNSQNSRMAFAENNSVKDQPLKAKQAQTFSNDWVSNKVQKAAPARVARNKTAPAQKYNDPVAYQQMEETPDLKADFDDLSPEKMDLTDQDPDYKTVDAGVTDIRATVGKSQIIQFAQPIKRISITDPALADLILLSPTQMIMNGKAAGVTSLIIWDEADQPAFFDLYVQNDTSDLLDAFRKVAPDEPINIKITDDGNVILTGTLSSTLVRDSIAKICEAYGYKLVDVAESPVPQVVLELRIAEIARSVAKNFSFAYRVGAWGHNPIAPNVMDSKAGVGGEWNGSSQAGFILAVFEPTQNFSGIMGMGQQKGLLNILAEPKIVTTNGRQADFDAGQSVPVPTGVDQNGNLAYEYKDIGVKVSFTPWISEKSERIELKITPEVSEIDSSVTISQPNGTVIYGFRKRKATTTVELENGETLMIAGLIRRNDSHVYIDPPFLGNIPIIGKFLSTSTFDKSESELVIMVTPKIIKPGVYGDVLGTSD